MAGNAIFHIVTDGIHNALTRARAAAQHRDVTLGGGVATLQQYLQAGLVDQLHLAIAPVLLGTGEALFKSTDLRKLGYACTEWVASPLATHLVLEKPK